MSANSEASAPPVVRPESGTVYAILFAMSASHFLNDLIQSLIPAIYPLLKTELSLDFGDIGLVTLAFHLSASVLQPVVGFYTDKRPMPFSLPIGMGFTLAGLLLLSKAWSFPVLLLAASLVGIGSAVFHPEASRVARMASGGRHGLAQSVFQVGGNVGSAAGPLLAALIVLPNGQGSVAWFSAVALLGMLLLTRVGFWYQARGRANAAAGPRAVPVSPVSRGVMLRSVGILVVLIFSKYFYMAAFWTYYTFYLMDQFGVGVQDSQLYLFGFLAAVALGTLLGGPIGDRIGRRKMLWISILGVLPFSILLPHTNLAGTVALSLVIGLILASTFSSIVVYAQELVPGKVGTIAGLFFGFAFGMGGLGAAVLGQLADYTSVSFVFQVTGYLPALGLLVAFLPDVERRKPA